MVWLRIRRWVVRPIFWSLAAVALVLLCLRAFLASDFARHRLATSLEQQLTQILHREVRLRRLDFELLPFALRIEDLSIAGPRPDAPPLLTVRRLRVEADLDALRRDVIDLETVSAQGVRFHLGFDREGHDDLPKIATGGGGGRFTLRIGGLFVDDGEFELDDQREPLAVEAHAILLRLSGLGGTELAGNVTAQQVTTTLPKAMPWASTLSAKVRIRDDRVEILTARVRSPAFTAQVAGDVGWRDGTRGELAGVIETQGRFLDDLGYLHGDIAGPIRFEGRVRFVHQDIRFGGEVTSPGVDLFGFRVDELAGKVDGDRKLISLTLEHGIAAGGAVTGRFAVDLTHPGPLAHLALQADGPRLRTVLEDLGLPSFGFATAAHGNLDYEFPLNDARRGAGSATVVLAAVPAERLGEVPAAGGARLTLVEGRLELTEVTLASAAQRVALHGIYDLVTKSGDLVVEVESTDLGELAALQPFVATEPPPLWLPDSGRGKLTVDVVLVAGAPTVGLALDLADLHAPGAVAARARGSLRVTADAVHDLDLELTGAGSSALHVSGFLPLSAGRAPTQPVDLDLTFRSWPVADAFAWLPAPLPLAGEATGTLHLGGSLAALTGEMQGTVAPVAVAGLAFDRLEADLDWNADRLRVVKARLSAPAGIVEGSGELAFAGDAIAFEAGSERLDLAAAPWSDLSAGRIVGHAALRASLTGTLAEPHFVVDGELADLELPSLAPAIAGGDSIAPPPTAVGGSLAPPPTSGVGETQRFAGTVHAELADRVLQARLDLPGLLTLTGGGPFVAGESGELAFRLASDRLDRLVALAAGRPVDGLSGSLEAEIGLHFVAGAGPVWTARSSALELIYENHRLRPLEPIVARLAASRATIDSFYLGEATTGDELFVSGTVDLAPAEPALDLHVQAAMSVDWLEPFVGLDLSGAVAVLASLKGSVAQPELNGEAALSGARWIPERFPHSFDRIEGLALLYPGAVVLDHLRADLAGGTVTASGRLDLAQPGKPLAYRAQIAARSTALRYPEGWLVRGDGDLTLQSTTEGRQLSGSVALDRVYYLQDILLSPRQLAERVLSRTRVQVEETDELLGTTYLNVSIVAPHTVRVRNNLANLTGSANLALRGTLANPVLFGDVTSDPGGKIEYNGSTYEVDRGVLTFANPARIEPLLDVVARTKINEYQVTLSVLGSLDRPTTTLASDPPLPDYDVLSLLATGSSTGLANISQNAPAGSTPGLDAGSLLYGQAASLVTQRVGKLFGIDRLKVDPLAGGDSLSAARVTIGKRLSSRVYLTYSVDPSSTAQQILQVEWKVSEDLTLVLTQNGDESYAVDAKWEKRF